MKQMLITPATGKRLIAKAMVKHPAVEKVIESGNLVIVAGTTNGYIAEEILSSIGQSEGFSKKRFFRGLIVPDNIPRRSSGRLKKSGKFPGDVVIQDGVWKKGKTIFEVVDKLEEGDLILKGANSLDIKNRMAGILIGHPKAGTIGAALQAVYGRRVKLIIPVGLEKRVPDDLQRLSMKMSSPCMEGPRLLPVAGDIFTEIEALKLLFDVDIHVIAAGGVGGAEGSLWIGMEGDENSLKKAEEFISSIGSEQLFKVELNE